MIKANRCPLAVLDLTGLDHDPVGREAACGTVAALHTMYQVHALAGLPPGDGGCRHRGGPRGPARMMVISYRCPWVPTAGASESCLAAP